METVLLVDDVEPLARRKPPTMKGRMTSVETVSWREFPARVRERAHEGIAVLNLGAHDALPIQETVRLRRNHPRLGVVYILDAERNLSQSTLTALSQPGVDFVSSRATDAELWNRVRRMIQAQEHRKSEEARRARPPMAPGNGGRSPWEHLMPALHNPRSGRLDAARTADWFGMPLKTLAGVLKRPYATVHKTPDAPALQPALKVFLRIASALFHQVGSDEGARVWLNAPNPDLEDDQSPLSIIELGEQEIIAEMLEDSLMGIPG